MLGLSLCFNSALNHIVALLDCLVEVFKNLHVVDVPVVASLHFRNSETKVVIEFFCNSKDLAEAVLLTGILLFHLFKFRLQVFDLLSGFHSAQLEFTDTDLPLVEKCFLSFFFDLSFNDFFFQNFVFCSCVKQVFLDPFVGSEQLLKTVGLSSELLLKLLNSNLWRDGPFFCHGITGRQASM